MSDPLQFFVNTTPGVRPAVDSGRTQPAGSDSFADVLDDEMQAPSPRRTEMPGGAPVQPCVVRSAHAPLDPPVDPVVAFRGPGQNTDRNRVLYPMPGHPFTPHGTSYHPPQES